MINRIIILKTLKNNSATIIVTTFFLLLLFYKLYLEYTIPILGDELNSILIYSTNLKTLFLKNFPGNATFFHLIGYLKSLIFGYDLLAYRSVSFLSVLLSLWVLKKLDFNETKIAIFFLILIGTNFTLTAGFYAGYNFTTAIYGVIFLLLSSNSNNKNNKIIFLLLFFQFYNHLVNLYLVFPIIISLFFYSNKKKIIKEFILYFLIPTCFFYFFSIMITGIAELKVEQVDIKYISLFITQNFEIIFNNGLNRIFFYEAYQNAKNFNLLDTIISLYNFDKINFFVILLCLVSSFYNFIRNRNKSIFTLVIILHFFTFFLVNKLPAPRIFTSFGIFYLLVSFYYLENIIEKISKLIIFKFLSLLLLLILIINLNYKEKIENSVYGKDITYKENIISTRLLKEKCVLINLNFSEAQKRNYYYNYLNFCKKKFNLGEFLIYYRSN